MTQRARRLGLDRLARAGRETPAAKQFVVMDVGLEPGLRARLPPASRAGGDDHRQLRATVEQWLEQEASSLRPATRSSSTRTRSRVVQRRRRDRAPVGRSRAGVGGETAMGSSTSPAKSRGHRYGRAAEGGSERLSGHVRLTVLDEPAQRLPEGFQRGVPRRVPQDRSGALDAGCDAAVDVIQRRRGVL